PAAGMPSRRTTAAKPPEPPGITLRNAKPEWRRRSTFSGLVGVTSIDSFNQLLPEDQHGNNLSVESRPHHFSVARMPNGNLENAAFFAQRKKDILAHRRLAKLSEHRSRGFYAGQIDVLQAVKLYRGAEDFSGARKPELDESVQQVCLRLAAV